MMSAALVTTVVEHPALPVRAFVDDSMLRRALVGICMALTAVVDRLLAHRDDDGGAHEPGGRR